MKVKEWDRHLGKLRYIQDKNGIDILGKFRYMKVKEWDRHPG
jgi:hypothetical protein